MDFINPTISGSEFIATNTLPVSLMMPTFSWHCVWPPVISQQTWQARLGSEVIKQPNGPQSAECIHAEMNSTFQRDPQKLRKKEKRSESTKSLRGESNPLGPQSYIFVFPALKTRVTSTLESLIIPMPVLHLDISFTTVSIRLYPHIWGKSLKSLKFLPATQKEKVACHMNEQV